MKETKEAIVWVTLTKYCELTGETDESVRTRRKRRIWKDGKQSRIGPNGNIWVNVKEAQQWVENGTD